MKTISVVIAFTVAAFAFTPESHAEQQTCESACASAESLCPQLTDYQCMARCNAMGWRFVQCIADDNTKSCETVTGCDPAKRLGAPAKKAAKPGAKKGAAK